MSIVLLPELPLLLEPPLLLLVLLLLLLLLLPHAASATTEPRTNKPVSPLARNRPHTTSSNVGPGRSTTR